MLGPHTASLCTSSKTPRAGSCSKSSTCHSTSRFSWSTHSLRRGGCEQQRTTLLTFALEPSPATLSSQLLPTPILCHPLKLNWLIHMPWITCDVAVSRGPNAMALLHDARIKIATEDVSTHDEKGYPCSWMPLSLLAYWGYARVAGGHMNAVAVIACIHWMSGVHWMSWMHWMRGVWEAIHGELSAHRRASSA